MNDVFVVGSAIFMILVIVFGILKLKISPIIALVAGSIILALINGIAPGEAVDVVLAGFGELMAEVGLLLFFGLLIGTLLTYLGAVGKVAASLLRVFGAKAMPYTFGVTIGTILASIFVEVNILITGPLAKKMAPELGKAGLARLTASIMIGVEVALTMVVPGIAALALSALLDVQVGVMLLVGLPIAILTIISAIAIMSLLFKMGLWKPKVDEVQVLAARIERANEIADHLDPTHATGLSHDGHEALVSEPGATPTLVAKERTTVIASAEGLDAPTGNSATAAEVPEFGSVIVDRQPNAFVSFAPLLLALLLIAGTAIGGVVGFTSPVLDVLGTPTVALLIALVGTQIVAQIYGSGPGLAASLKEGTSQSGEILMLTGVGACLAAVVDAIGLGDILIEWFQPGSFAPLLVVWVIAAVLHVAIGSVTTSAITAAGILAPIAGDLGVNPVLVALAAGAGSMFVIHVTSNAFWMVSAMMGFTTRGGLKTVTLPVTVASCTGLVWVLIANLFI